VRLLARDEAKRVHAAAEFVSSGAWISHLALAQTIWVLDAVYERTAEQIATAIDMLLDHQHLAMQDADVVAAALACFRKYPALGFSDCLMLEIARKSGHLLMGAFDRDLAKLAGVRRIG
jgi:predicted nucleic-acid-binding protein